MNIRKLGQRVKIGERSGEILALSESDLTCLVRYYNYELEWMPQESTVVIEQKDANPK